MTGLSLKAISASAMACFANSVRLKGAIVDEYDDDDEEVGLY